MARLRGAEFSVYDPGAAMIEAYVLVGLILAILFGDECGLQGGCAAASGGGVKAEQSGALGGESSCGAACATCGEAEYASGAEETACAAEARGWRVCALFVAVVVQGDDAGC